jgi:uncharacterized spore protein YtfJ
LVHQVDSVTSMMDLKELMSRASDTLSVGRAFGPSYEKDGVLVIPVAWVAGGAGGGSGTDSEHGGSGDGGGFGGVTWPLGVYAVKDGDVRWIPAVDVTRLILAGAALARTVIKLAEKQRGGKRSR